MAIEVENGVMHSEFVREEYLPAKVTYGKPTDYCRHVMLERDDTDALELSLDPETGELLKIVLVLCNHMSIEEGPLSTPEHIEGFAKFDMPRTTDCPAFHMTVHDDGVSIHLLDELASSHVKCGQVVFGITSAGDIAEVLVACLRQEDIEHLLEELGA